jgi:hypothetical protein
MTGIEWDSTRDAEVTALSTLQFGWGGLFDTRPIGSICLVRSTRTGTPGPSLCGIDRFAADAPGWSIGGGVSNPNAQPCAGCTEVRSAAYPDRGVSGMFKSLFPAAVPA